MIYGNNFKHLWLISVELFHMYTVTYLASKQNHSGDHALLSLTHQENMSLQLIPPKTPLLLVTLGYAGIYLFFLFLAQNIDCGCRGGSNMYPGAYPGGRLEARAST